MSSTTNLGPTKGLGTRSLRRFERALVLAARAHCSQARKGTDIPYITHPVHVARILELYGFEEDLVIAGLLHDVAEDTRVSIDTLKREFGRRVRDLVAAVSEDKKDKDGKERPWKVRKREQLSHLKTAPPDVAALKAADALHNVTTILADYEKIGDCVWMRFNAGKDNQLWYYGALVKALRKVTGSPLLDALDRAVHELELAVGRATPPARKASA